MDKRLLVATTAAAGLTLSTWGGALPAQAERAGHDGDQPAAAVSSSPLKVWAPSKTTAYTYSGRLYLTGPTIVAQNQPFEVWSKRGTYRQQIRTRIRLGTRTVDLPAGHVDNFSGLPNFYMVTVRDDRGKILARTRTKGCLAGEGQRMSPDAALRSPYPTMCPTNRLTKGSVMGIQEGWTLHGPYEGIEVKLPVKAGTFNIAVRITDPYAVPLGILPKDRSATSRVTVVREGSAGFEQRVARTGDSPAPQPRETEPRGDAGGSVAGPLPDLQSLPAFGMRISRNGNFLQFSANVWNAGSSPLVVDGFRRPDEATMDAYQYFFDAAGNETGYQKVGTMHWHDDPTHLHWHFLDFARYRLLNADRTKAVRSQKESFCLANTDAVDFTVPGADWRPDTTDLSSACGEEGSLSLREVLSAGSGDTYAQFRAGQSFKLKGLPNGKYFVAVEANPEGRLVESDKTNNDWVRPVWIGGRPGARTLKVGKIGVLDVP